MNEKSVKQLYKQAYSDLRLVARNQGTDAYEQVFADTGYHWSRSRSRWDIFVLALRSYRMRAEAQHG